jgi:short-subunit dehydrogenase
MTLPAPAADRTALVTGASSGIGVELARELAGRGHGVTLVARREDRLRELAAELTAAHGTRNEVIGADLAEPGSRAAVLDAVAERGLTVDVLVNNAGLSTSGPVHASDVEAELRMVRVDVEAVVELCSRVVPGMVERGRGAVLNVASVGAFQPLPGQAGYGGSKAFVLAYTDALHAELAGTGVTATSLCPGPVETGFGEAAGISQTDAEGALPRFMWETPEAVARAGIAGLDRGRSVVIPGAANRVGAYAGRILPNRLLLPVLARQHPALRRT